MKYYFFSGTAQDPTTGAITHWNLEKSSEGIPSFNSIRRQIASVTTIPEANITILNYKEMTKEEYFAF